MDHERKAIASVYLVTVNAQADAGNDVGKDGCGIDPQIPVPRADLRAKQFNQNRTLSSLSPLNFAD